ncbi:MAG: hypothetical protein MJY44_00730 [Bacteroidales bacterium]|nr:hypothetical protein [Bacteroidales bacterium]
MKTKNLISLLLGACVVSACTWKESAVDNVPATDNVEQMSDVAKMMSDLPLGKEHLDEVFLAVNGSSDNGYDEEYMFSDLFTAPGKGVGGSTKSAYRSPSGSCLRDLITEYVSSRRSTKAGSASEAEDYLNSLSSSDLQIYWPYSDNWDGEEFPIVTFDPGYGSETNYGYRIRMTDSGARVVDSVVVNEAVAQTHPVWVINRNDDCGFTPLDVFSRANGPAPQSASRKLMLKSFTMLRNYDSWFGGASEFFIKCGSVNGFSARTEAEMRNYQPSVTDFVVVVKRRYVGKAVPFDVMLISDFTSQMSKIAFIVVEDDGGTTTNWKCSAMVKINSKSYGFEMDIPYKEKDDIVWRGQIDASFFQEEDEVTGRFGDVLISFALE